jgi:Uma2 family endonuclease
MQPKDAIRRPRPKPFVAPFENGDHMDQKTFHRLYMQTPEGFKAELVGGIVYVASPTTHRHGRPHARVVIWLGGYVDATPGTDVLDNTTNVLAEDSEPQPDACLLVAPEYGGQTSEDEKGYVVGPPELVVEVALSSAAIDLHAKRRDYERAGVREYVIALVETEQVVWYGRGRKGFAELTPGPDGVLRSRVYPGLWLDPAALFERSPRRLLATLRGGLSSEEHAAFVAKLEARRGKRRPKPKSR